LKTPPEANKKNSTPDGFSRPTRAKRHEVPTISKIKESMRQIAANALKGWQREDIRYDKPETWPQQGPFSKAIINP